MDELEVRDLRPGIARPVGPPGDLDGVERLAHGAIADGVDVDLEPERIEPGDGRGEGGGLDQAVAAVRGWQSVAVEIRLEHGAREVLEDAVGEELDARRRVARPRRSGPSLDQLLDLLRRHASRPS